MPGSTPSATRWRRRVAVGDLILVCDVGGGTTDFSLIAVAERDGDLALERVAVGEHILLGGDNMDLALARLAAAAARGRRAQGRHLAAARALAPEPPREGIAPHAIRRSANGRSRSSAAARA